MRNRLPVWVVLVLGLLLWRPCSSNFVAYDEDHELNDGDDQEYLQDADHRRPQREDYHDALDRLITHALNQTHHGGESAGNPAALVDSKVTAVSTTTSLEVDEEPPECAANRQPIPIPLASQLTVAKCCPEGQTFLHESIVKCKIPLRKIRLPIISRRVHLYDDSCYHLGGYLKPNVTSNGRCIGKRLVFNKDVQFTVIQNGSLLVTNREQMQMAIYRDFCLEETASTVMVAYICDELIFPDPFDWVDKLVIGTALVVLFLTVLLYGFERNFHCVFGKLIMVHVGLLFTALLLEAALTEFEEAFYSLIVYTLIGASYVIFAAANLHNLISNQSSFQKMDTRNVAYVAFGCCLLWLASVLFTLYCDEKITTLCTVFAALLLSVLVNVITLRGIVSRRHHLLTAVDNCYDISDSAESTTYQYHRKELTILATFAALVQVLHWALYAAGRYNLLYGLSWCGLTVFAVFVCFRYRSITVLFCTGGGSGGSRKVLRHHHHHQQQQDEQHQGEDTPPSSILQLAGQDQPRPPPISTSSPYYSQLTSSSSSNGSQYYHHHQQENQDNQKHMALPPVAEEEGGGEEERRTTSISTPFS